MNELEAVHELRADMYALLDQMGPLLHQMEDTHESGYSTVRAASYDREQVTDGDPTPSDPTGNAVVARRPQRSTQALKRTYKSLDQAWQPMIAARDLLKRSVAAEAIFALPPKKDEKKKKVRAA
jgi:hypothetical protein